MGHIAVIKKNNGIVQTVLVVDNSKFLDNTGKEVEEIGVSFIKKLVKNIYPEEYYFFKQCSYNATIRKNYPGIGFSYDSQKDAFISPNPFNSWQLDETTCKWKAPLEAPKDGKNYIWDEKTLNYKEVELQKP